MEKLEMLEELLKSANEMKYTEDVEEAHNLKAQTELYIVKIFGEESRYLSKLKGIGFLPSVYYSGMSAAKYKESFESGRSEIVRLINTLVKDVKIDLRGEDVTVLEKQGSRVETKNCVFIVHGHDELVKVEVARTLDKLGVKNKILHEQPDKGRNVLEKLIEEGKEADFAIVLLTPDDFGRAVKDDGEINHTRARQNVILELGYFMGSLGKNRVVALYKPEATFELPSDIVGTLYKEYDERGNWKYELVRELKAAGFEVDANRLLS